MNDSSNIYERVGNHYGALAKEIQPAYSGAIAKAFGYTQAELDSIPAGANLGVSCGNPLAIASLRKGETVIDLGSGAGFDVFLASKKVGASGRAIGVDMNPDMLARARSNQAKLPEASNVSFVRAKITSIPLEDGIADCVISNCVINLVPETEKPTVFREIARLLTSGGRVAVSDILARKPLPKVLRESVGLYVGCVAGASTKEDYENWLKDAGFSEIVIVDAESDLNVYIDMARNAQAGQQVTTSSCEPSASELSVCCEGQGRCTQEDGAGAHAEAGSKAYACCSPSCCGKLGDIKQHTDGDTKGTAAEEHDLSHVNINDWAGSFKIFAVKT